MCLQEWREQVCEPSSEALPACAEGFPVVFRQLKAFLLVVLEHADKLLRSAFVDDYGIVFHVETQTSGVEVGTSNGAKSAVDGYNLRVMKSRFVDPDIYTVLHQPVDIIEHAVWREWNIAFGRHHYFHFHPSPDSASQCFLQPMVECKVWVYEHYAVLCGIDGFDVEVSYNAARRARLSVNDAYGFAVGCVASVLLQVAEGSVVQVSLIVFGAFQVLMRNLVP